MKGTMRQLGFGLLVAASMWTNAVAQEQTWKLNLQEAELSDVIQQVSQITAKTYVLGPNIRRKVTLASAEPLTSAGVERLFMQVLATQGLRVQEDQNVIRIEESGGVQDAGKYTIIPLHNARVENVIPMVEKLLPAEGAGVYATADTMSNAVVLYGKDDVRERVGALINSIDQDHAARADMELFYLENADASKIGPILAELFKNQTDPNRPNIMIKAEPSLNAIAVQASPQIIAQVGRIIKKIDVERAQVLIEAIIVEVSGELAKEIGVQIAAGDAAGTAHQGSTSFDAPSGSNMLNLTSVLKALNVPAAATMGGGLNVLIGDDDVLTVLLQALAKSQYANLLSTPSIMTLDNEQAKIVVGQNVPFRTGTFTTDNSGANNPFTTISREDVGISLNVLPRVHRDGKVQLQVKQEVSAVVEKTLAGAADIVTNKRTIETSVVAADGEVIVLGGLMQDDMAENKSKVPVLGDIPVIGQVFSSTGGNYTKRNLLVFLRPQIVHDQAMAQSLAKAHYDKMQEVRAHWHDNHVSGEPEIRSQFPPVPMKDVPSVDRALARPWMLD